MVDEFLKVVGSVGYSLHPYLGRCYSALSNTVTPLYMTLRLKSCLGLQKSLSLVDVSHALVLIKFSASSLTASSHLLLGFPTLLVPYEGLRAHVM